MPEAYPVKAPRRVRPTRTGRTFWILRDRAVWLVQRPGKGMLGGMRALPDDGWSARADGHGRPPFAADWRPAGQVSHGFTHFDLTLSVWTASGGAATPPGDGAWWPLDRLGEAGLPSLFAKAAERARGPE
jgi:A/G-specific adenine glycosylase